jgi:hypothetical protein
MHCSHRFSNHYRAAGLFALAGAVALLWSQPPWQSAASAAQAATITSVATTAEEKASEWIRLFDGRTLEGWRLACKPADRDKEFWSVREGAITADSLGRKDHDYVWLMHGGEFSDFELTARVRGFRESPGNSGIQVRSRYDENAGWLDGPQVDIHPPAPWRSGLIYDETREARRWIFPSLPNWDIDVSQGPAKWKWEADGWNEIRIVCRKTRIQTWVNGLPIADLDGEGLLNDEAHRSRRVGMSGQIALQLHSKDELRIQYKDLLLRKLR